jgi:hypothetical protein
MTVQDVIWACLAMILACLLLRGHGPLLARAWKRRQWRRRAERRKRARKDKPPKPFEGLTRRPVCALCVAEAEKPAGEKKRAPPPRIKRIRGRRPSVDTTNHFCPHKNCPYYGWLDRGNIISHGRRMHQPYGWSFHTGDYSPPEVQETVPADDPLGTQEPVSVETAVRAWFDEPLDSGQLAGVEFTLRGPSGLVSGSLKLVQEAGVGAAHDGLRFTPKRPLEEESAYEASLVGAVDQAGNAMTTAYEWAFITGKVSDLQGTSGTRVTKYYAFGGKMVALRVVTHQGADI